MKIKQIAVGCLILFFSSKVHSQTGLSLNGGTSSITSTTNPGLHYRITNAAPDNTMEYFMRLWPYENNAAFMTNAQRYLFDKPLEIIGGNISSWNGSGDLTFNAGGLLGMTLSQTNGSTTIERILNAKSISNFYNTLNYGGDATSGFGLTTWGAGLGGLGIGTNSGKGDLIFFTDYNSSTQALLHRMIIKQNTGYVGIGTTTPLEKLHVDGTVLSNGLKFAMAGRKLEFYESANARAHILLYNSANGNIEIENNWIGGDAHIILNPDKNVGIGTFNPVSTLEIFNPNGAATELTISGNSNGAIDAGLVLKANNAGANFNGSGIFMHDKTAANEWFVGRPYATSDMFTICRKTGTTDHMRETSMLDNSQALFSVLNDGKIGIGTTAPTAKLEIKASDNNSSLFSIKDNAGGDILKVRGQDRTMYVRSLEVTLLNFPDYVFEKNYPLMPLKEVESYIQANKHLPNIPSAKEIEENGANLGDLVKLQMEKIEELTLYLIELQKASEATNKENVEIKKQLEELKMK